MFVINKDSAKDFHNSIEELKQIRGAVDEPLGGSYPGGVPFIARVVARAIFPDWNHQELEVKSPEDIISAMDYYISQLEVEYGLRYESGNDDGSNQEA